MKVHARTPRLLLRDWTMDDVEPYLDIVSDPDVMRHIGDGEPRTREYAEKFVRRSIRHQESRGWMRFAAEHVETGRFMGFSGFDWRGEPGGPLDFGWRLGRDFWGQGFGYEASAAALHVGREAFGLEKITAQSYPENVGSIRIMEKMGMERIGEDQEHGRPLVIYGFPSEWPDGFVA
ncbi:MAG: GNAT family N-acetyltransferase [Rhodothermales bacterium]|nr:GNAT family N-acetyltransferase [Rhodothermales bacterium]